MLCKLTPEEEVRMHILLKGIADDPNALEMQKFIQHGSVTTYEHCLRVTRIAFWLNIHLHVRADEASLVKGAFLHDFYLYDWHNCSNITHWHGFKHARIARYNAETVFKLTDKEKDIIQSHMWPLNPTDIPHSREAALVCMADKMSSSYETVLERNEKKEIKHFLAACSLSGASATFPHIGGACLAEEDKIIMEVTPCPINTPAHVPNWAHPHWTCCAAPMWPFLASAASAGRLLRYWPAAG